MMLREVERAGEQAVRNLENINHEPESSRDRPRPPIDRGRTVWPREIFGVLTAE